jgi:cytochrome P450
VTIREVHADTTIVGDSTWKLKKGSIVTMPSSLTHRSPQLFDKPEEFHIKRFLPVELGGEGADPKKGVRPFGGGASYCPGRVFAEKQVMGFLAVVIGRYEIRIVEGEEVVHPNLDFDNVVKQKPVKLEFRRRKMLV